MSRVVSPVIEPGTKAEGPAGHVTTSAIGVDPVELGVPSAGFEPAHTAPEADALSPELRGRAGRG